MIVHMYTNLMSDTFMLDKKATYGFHRLCEHLNTDITFYEFSLICLWYNKLYAGVTKSLISILLTTF